MKTAGWTIFIAAVGMMCTLLAVDISNLQTFNQAITPGFVGLCLGHLGAVIGAFVGGVMVPPTRDLTDRTRATDPETQPSRPVQNKKQSEVQNKPPTPFNG